MNPSKCSPDLYVRFLIAATGGWWTGFENDDWRVGLTFPLPESGSFTSQNQYLYMGVVLSPSALGLFRDCPRCFWLDKVRKVRRPAGIFPSLPSGMDRVLKEHFDGHRREESLPEELAGFSGRLFPDLGKLEEWRDFRRGLRWSDDSSGFSLMGAVDDLFVTDDGLHAPLDYKTRGYPRKDNTHEYYQHQMDLYSLLLEKNGFPPADYAILVFYHPTGVNQQHDVVFHADAMRLPVDRERGLQLFQNAVACLRSSQPEPREECEWCRWVSNLIFE